MLANCLVFFLPLLLFPFFHSRACLGLSALTQPWASSGPRMRISRTIWLMWVNKSGSWTERHHRFSLYFSFLLHVSVGSICVFSLSLFQVVDDQCSCFNNIEQLKDRPAHLLVFLQHVILQFDPAPLVRPANSIMQHAVDAECIESPSHASLTDQMYLCFNQYGLKVWAEVCFQWGLCWWKRVYLYIYTPADTTSDSSPLK